MTIVIKTEMKESGIKNTFKTHIGRTFKDLWLLINSKLLFIQYQLF